MLCCSVGLGKATVGSFYKETQQSGGATSLYIMQMLCKFLLGGFTLVGSWRGYGGTLAHGTNITVRQLALHPK